MANREVNLTKRVKTSDGLGMVPIVAVCTMCPSVYRAHYNDAPHSGRSENSATEV